MSRADEGRRQAREDERDRVAHERPNEPPDPFDQNPDAWESRCAGNRTQHHLAPTAKLHDNWRCGSCGRWLRPPKWRHAHNEGDVIVHRAIRPDPHDAPLRILAASEVSTDPAMAARECEYEGKGLAVMLRRYLPAATVAHLLHALIELEEPDAAG
jgi:hypothetical protein